MLGVRQQMLRHDCAPDAKPKDVTVGRDLTALFLTFDILSSEPYRPQIWLLAQPGLSYPIARELNVDATE
jgi:hypothetical protein